MSGVIVWLTGLPSSGKTTVASLAHHELKRQGVSSEHLDGDEVRRYLGRELGFSAADRAENVRRIAYVARLLASQGVTVFVSAISPYRAMRNEVRAQSERFIEVHVAAEISVCRARDITGLYARQARGEIRGLTGVDDPYEPPITPELVLHTDREQPEVSTARLLALLGVRAFGF